MTTRTGAIVSAIAAALCTAAATAQSIEAKRYVNEQGIEILLSRNSPGPRAAPGADAEAPAPRAPTSQGPAAPANAAGPAPAAVSWRVTPAQQASRDDERMTILTQELLVEGRQLDLKRKALASQSNLSEAERQKLTDDVRRHEEGVRSISREMAPLRRASSDARNSQPR